MPRQHHVTISCYYSPNVVNSSDEIKGAALVPAFALAKVLTFFGGTVDQTLFGMIIKDQCANPVVEFGIEEGTSILVQLEPTIVHVATTPTFVAIIME
jgi:hypothetical protein